MCQKFYVKIEEILVVHLATRITYLNKHDIMYLQSKLIKNELIVLQGHKTAVGNV